MLEVQNLTKSYGSKVAVDDLSFTVHDGDIFGFIGSNGAGKTTTIKAIAGIHSFNSGEILINGLSIRTQPLECKKIMAYIPDNPDIYEFMTGQRYINFVANIFGVSQKRRLRLTKKYS
ncbi:MAG: ATP-binding cassette domain-containing protein, partial [Actinomycetia bacterium]|nr:ATP-binding cassette domain-containing protein [Actinomycetes bacterium]